MTDSEDKTLKIRVMHKMKQPVLLKIIQDCIPHGHQILNLYVKKTVTKIR